MINVMKKSYYFILLVIIFYSCSGPKFSQFESTYIKSNREIKSEAKPNYIFEKELMNKVRIPDDIYQSFSSSSVVFVSNYNLYPFNKSKSSTDSTPAVYRVVVDKEINQELGISLEQQLISRRFNVLENEEVYNVFDDNSDEYDFSLNFEIRRYGFYYEITPNDAVVRHGECEVRYRVLSKNGHLKYISDKTFTHRDTILKSDLSSVSLPRTTLGYSNIVVDRKLSDFTNPILGGASIPTKYSTVQAASLDSVEKVTGMVFKLPSETKEYTFWVFDYEAVKIAQAAKGGGALSLADLIYLIPKKIVLKSNKVVLNDNVPEYYGIVSYESLKDFFSNSNEIVIFYKAKKMKALRKYSDGSIAEII